MANNDVVTGDLNYADRLWKAADALRGQVDAAEYKHVVLGLLFLKYISDTFESRRDDLRAELRKTASRANSSTVCSNPATSIRLSASSGCRRNRGGRTFRTRLPAPTSRR